MAIELKNVKKSFGKTRALDNVTLTIGGNKIFGLLGNNGAGKSTLYKVITSRLFASAGSVTLDGQVIRDNDAALGQIYMIHERSYFGGMKFAGYLKWAKRFYPSFDINKALELAEMFKLPTNKNLSTLSTGYRSIYKICAALAVNTPYLLLDEPVLGLDARHREMFYKALLEHYGDNPGNIVLSTHLIDEAAFLIEHCIVIDNGKIIRDAPAADLLAEGYSVSGLASEVDIFTENRKVLNSTTVGALKTAFISGEVPKKAQLPLGLELGRMSLQEYFVKLVGDGEESSKNGKEG